MTSLIRVGTRWNDLLAAGDMDEERAVRFLGLHGNDTLRGGAGDDTVRGGKGEDLLYGRGGDDLLRGEGGDDTMFGGNGRDTLRGDGGDDIAFGGGGDDRINGGDGDDMLSGGAGDDLLAGDRGNDTLHGGSGIDTASFSSRASAHEATLLAAGGIQLRDLRGPGGTDLLRDIELLRFSDGTIDLRDPALRLSVTGVAEDTGTPGDGLTANATPVLVGTAAAGAQVGLFRDGVLVAEAVAAGDGSWQIADAAAGAGLADGSYAYTARTTAPGGLSLLTEAFTLTIDTTAPAAPVVGLAAGDDTGIQGDLRTSLGRVDLVGTAESGARIEVLGSGIAVVAGADGSFVLEDIALTGGANAIQLSITDAAGNTTGAVVQVESQDPVLAWNIVTLEAIKAAGSVTAIASRVLAMQSAAILDAMAGADGEGGLDPLMVALQAPPGIDGEVAAAAAAHRILTHLYPGQAATFDARLQIDVAGAETGAQRDAAVDYGRAVADAVIAIRADDGWNAVVPYVPGTDPGDWVPTPRPGLNPGDPERPGQPAHLPHWGDVATWGILDGAQFRREGPPALDSADYAAAFDQVKRLGAIDSTERTAEQTEIAFYWRDQAGTYTPAGRWAQIGGEVLETLGLGPAENARIMAILNFAQADGAISAWDTKYAFNSWRPVTAIRKADTDGNDATDPVAGWTPLLTTPNHPDYVSGHSTCSMAAAYTLQLLLGEIAFSNEGVGLPGVVRSFDNFVDAAVEASLSRVYGGIHFSFACEDGLDLGQAVAEYGVARMTSEQDTYAPHVLLPGVAGGTVAAPPVIQGLAFDNRGLDEVLVALDGGAAVEVAVDGLGRFTADIAALFGPLADGAYLVTISAEDAAGNTAARTLGFTLDAVLG